MIYYCETMWKSIYISTSRHIIYIFTYIFIYTYINIYIYIYMNIFTYVHIYIYTVYIYIHIFTYVHICIHTYIHVYILHIYKYVYIYIYHPSIHPPILPSIHPSIDVLYLISVSPPGASSQPGRAQVLDGEAALVLSLDDGDSRRVSVLCIIVLL